MDYIKDASGKTILEKHKLSKNWRKTWLELCLTMELPEYLNNLAVQADKLMQDVVYKKGKIGTFGIKKYHQLMTQAFNIISEAHNFACASACDTQELSESQKITKFLSQILKENHCAKTCIEAKKELWKKSLHEQSFNNFYVDMLRSSLSKYRIKVLKSDTATRNFNINHVDYVFHDPSTTGNQSGRGGCGRGHTNGRRCGRSGHGHG